jgi:hypothetical protein
METQNAVRRNQLEQVILELDWLEKIIQQRIIEPTSDLENLLPVLAIESPISKIVAENNLNYADRVLLLLALAGRQMPEKLAVIFKQVKDNYQSALFGGHATEGGLCFIPTLKTAIYLLAGDTNERAYYSAYFNKKNTLFLKEILILKNTSQSQYSTDFEVCINEQFLNTLLFGEMPRLDGDTGFGATLIETKKPFDEIILSEKTRSELEYVLKFIRSKDELFKAKEVQQNFEENYIVVFKGLPGTGKTVTAKSIGQKFGLPVYKVNLAAVVSKYVGATEKKLDRIFNRLHGQNCILFFDEADALFGKRTEVNNSNDRYANQQTALLLEKIEAFKGIVILASNIHDIEIVLDMAFQRRISLVVDFEFPERAERQLLWEKTIPANFNYDETVLRKAVEYQLTGASIKNIVFESLILATDLKTKTLTWAILEPNMRREFKKTGNRQFIPVRDEVADDEARLGRRGANRGNFKN